MKPPLRTDPITITARAEHGSGYDYVARVQVGERKLKATSTCTAESAARNLALRHFFGGNTNAFVGDAERDAVQVTPMGHSQYRAELIQ